MTRRAAITNNLSKGVLDPALSERIDTPHYWNGLESGLNLEIFPQGGCRRRAGTSAGANGAQRIRRRLRPIAVSSAMVTAPNGGTVASLVDQSTATRFTTAAATTSPFVVAEIDLGTAQDVAAFDVIGFGCETGRYPRALGVEYWDGAAWQPFAASSETARKMLGSGISTDTMVQSNLSSKGTDAVTATFTPYDAGRITKIKATLDGPLAGAAATVTVKISGVAVTGGVVTIPVSGSGDGVSVEVTPTGANSFTAEDEITATIGGGSTATGTLDIAITVEQEKHARTRRFALAPGATMTAARWRIAIHGAAGAGAVSVGGIRMWKEKRQLSPHAEDTFTRAADLVYEWVLTDRNIDIFRDRVWQASVPVDIDAQQIARVTWSQSLDSLIIYDEDIATIVVQRQGANDEWNSAPAAWTNVPKLTPGSAFAGDQDEIQDVTMAGVATGDALVIWLADKVTSAITYAPSTFAADAVAALAAIGVDSGLAVERIDTATTAWRFSFFGNAGARRWPLLALVALDRDDIDATTAIVQRGLDAQGPVIGETTGYPRCGVTYQERHIVAGMRAAPITYAASRYGLAFDLQDDADPLTADLAFLGTINSDHADIIERIYVGRHLLFFTTSGEWYTEARTLDATQPFSVQLGTRIGIRPNVPVLFADGAPVFIDRSGRTLRDFVYSDVELTYKADPLSLLGPHLLTDVVKMGYRQQRSTGEGHNLFMVNADGTIAFMPLLKSQEVVGTVPWATDGRFSGVITDILARVFLIVEREADGAADHYIEKLDGSHTLDAAVTPDDGIVRAEVSGLDHLEGKDVWAWVDRGLVGPLRVSGGIARLPAPGVVTACGLAPALRGRLPRLREKLQNGYPFRPPARVVTIDLALAGTGQIDIAVNSGPFRDVPLTFDGSRALDIAAEPPRDTTGAATASRQAESLERMLRAVTMIPGSGMWVYATELVTVTTTYIDSSVDISRENMHNTSGSPDILVSLGQLRQAAPDLKRVSLFVSWFGTDLRAANCAIVPKVDRRGTGTGIVRFATRAWSCAGLNWSTAGLVSTHAGSSAYGGTPADWSVVQAIEAMKAQGLDVTFTPFLVMDVAAGNTLSNPYGGTGQPAYPWRGRITCHPAPGQPGSPDLTATAATQIAAFTGTCSPGDFHLSGQTVVYTGPNEWSYRRMVLHYAWLCKAAGGVDTFVIGSEMRGLNWVRSSLGVYPFVAALAALAADVKSVLGADTKITYAADWSEFTPHQTGVPGECFFHLDPLWSSALIDAIGIDNYMPLSDWRAGVDHADFAAGHRSITDRAYLQGNIAGGEYFDWYYASPSDRDAQVRAPITDSDYGEPWVWRAKDLAGWWSNAHHNRPAGVRAASATAWVPSSKPIWFMELGCPAVDKGPNQPNVFYDPKSSESFFPYYSTIVRDDAVQRAFLEAHLAYWTPGMPGFSDAGNPVSPVYGGRMVDAGRIHVYTWDARFYPGFPELIDVWGDGGLWTYGHWLTGRLTAAGAGAGDALPVGLTPELPMRDRLATGIFRVTNLRGFSRHPTIEFSQSVPAPLELRSIRYEVVTHG